MKIFILSLLSVIIMCAVSCKNNSNLNIEGIINTDVENEGLKGKVKIVVDSMFSAKEMFGEVIKDTLEYTATFVFDTKGNMTKYYEYYGNGKLEYGYTYYHEHQKDKKETKRFNESNELIDYNIRTYNKKKLPVRIDMFDQNSMLISRMDFTYDKSFRLTSCIQYGHDGQIEKKWSFTYNADNSYERKLFESYRCTVVKYNSDNTISKILVYDYDFEEDEVEELEEKWIYSDDHNVTGFIYDYNEELEQKICQVVDEWGMIVKSITYDEKDKAKEMKSYKYTYDKKGNWIQCIGYVDNKANIIRERQITYY